MSESADMAKTAIVYKNVADGLDTVEAATDSIISTMKAFGIESKDTMGIIDRFNEVGNNFAITSAGIGDALQRSASALYAGGNTIDESIALVTAANSVIQNPEQVGTALKTLTLRLRGAKVELEEAGLETENMAESTSTLQKKLKALTHGKVDIMLDADTFKNTTQILREMSTAWEDMTDIERAAALELMGGKRQANILSSLITNFDTVEDVIETSMNSSGSAIKENEKYLDSIQGKLDQFQNSLQAFWNNMLDSRVIKGVIDFGIQMIKILDTIPGKITAVVVALAGFAKFKGINFFNLGPEMTQNIKAYSQAITQLSALKSMKLDIGAAGQWDTTAVQAYANAVKGLSAAEQAEMLTKQGLNREQTEEIMRRAGVEDAVIRETLSKKNLTRTAVQLQAKTVEQVFSSNMSAQAMQNEAMAAFLAENGHKKLTKALLDEAKQRGLIDQEQYVQYVQNLGGSWKTTLGEMAKSPGVVMMASMAIAGLISKIKTAKEVTEEMTEEYDRLQSAISEIDGEIDSLDSEMEKLQDRIEELTSQDKLSLADAEELSLLKQQSSELQRQKALQEQLLVARERQEDAKSLQMINNMLETTAANQQRAAESSATAWKIVLGVVGAAAAAVAGFYTGGATWSALPTMLSFAVGGAAVGSALGEKIGYGEGMDSKSVGNSLIEWYESYEKAIADAEKEASEAEAKYMSKMTDKNYEKWQKKVEALNTLQTEMYDGLTEMQGYISNLEYDDSTSAIIDGYNDLMTHLSVESNDGNIDAQISSIESLKNEFYELSRGVDENGKNVALSSEEYARYCDIVDQILTYTPSLINGYDEEGNAILGAADAQYTYNQLIAESIELLKEQRRQAAVKAVSDDALSTLLKNAQSEYDAYVEGAVKSPDSPKVLYYNENMEDTGEDTDTSTWDANASLGIIQSVTGQEKKLFESKSSYFKRNIDLIAKERNEIEETLFERLISEGVDEGRAKQYVDDYMAYIDSITKSIQNAEEQANAKIRNQLYITPQSFEHYDDLSGSQLTFINSYIDSFDNLKDKTDKELSGIRDNIFNLTSLINSSGNLQDSIDELITLDPSSMPVDAYRQKFEELWADIEGIIPEADRDALHAQLFPDSVEIDKMIADVQEKLAVGSRGLVKNLSLEELRIAYKIIPELSDNISFEELRQEIQERLPKATGPIVQTYSTLTEQVSKFNEVVVQTSEIILDNTKVTQEYKDSLIELGVSEEELAECFDATNSLVVTNAKELNKLVKSAKKNTAQNARLAKSQARLQYYELYKEMDRLVGANGEITEGNIDVVRSLYEEMNALEKTIAKYSMLEAQLLGNVNAFEKFQEAQEIDSSTDYIGGAEEMVLALGEAFTTAELGSETAQAAIMGLVPESVYEDLDTVDEKMAAIYEYFRKGKIAQYFTLEYDDDGNIESAEMKLGNLRKFIEDGLSGDANGDGINPFVGEDWKHFELNQTWLDSLPEGTDILQALADQMGVTKEVAFAFVKSFKDHDIEWLDGDYSTFFDQMLASTNEGKIQLYTERLADLTMQQAELAAEKNEVIKQFNNGAISEDEYNQRIEEINKKQEELNTSLDDYNTKLAEAKNASKQNIFGVGEKGTQYEGKADYQIKTSSEIEATTDINELDNWIERNEKVKQLQEDQAEAQEAYQEALEEYNSSERTEEDLAKLEEAEKVWKDTTTVVANAIAKRDEFAQPTVLEIQVAVDDVEEQIESTKQALDKKLANGVVIRMEVDGQQIEQDVASTEELLQACFHMDEDGYWVINPGVDMATLQQKYPEIFSYVNLLNSNTTLHAFLNDTEAQATLDDLSTQIQEIIDLLSDIKVALSEDSKTTFLQDCQDLLDNCGLLGKVINIGVKAATGGYSDTGDTGESGPQKVNGTAHVRGTAHASGNWGLPTSEHNALVGELGPEMVVDPHSGRYYTVGDTGAEMVDLPKGAIIFNHQQTKSLLDHGYITSRGKAYAEGNAHITIWPNQTSVSQWEGTGYSGPDDPTYDDASDDISSAADDLSDAADEFKEVFDWIEVRLEEINEKLSLKSAELENAIGFDAQNALIDEIIGINEELRDNLRDGADEYYAYAGKLLEAVPDTYKIAAQDGTIAIEEFVGEVDEETLNAIQEYREWVQKGADATRQAEEVLTEISSLAKQAFDNVADEFENKLSLDDNKMEQFEAYNDLIETDKGFASESIYEEIKKLLQGEDGNGGKKALLAEQRDAMQAELNKRVEAGEIKVESADWYDAVNAIAEVDTEIINLNTEIEDLQDSINELHWDKFDLLITQFEAVEEEADNLLDILATKDAVDNLGNWTDEGITQLGLLAQKLEVAEMQAEKYKNEIDYLNANWKELGYTQEEYVEKLDELKSGQYNAINAYHDTKDAIVDLNKERVEAIKDGIEKEIEAYEELIEKKKEELDAEKDLYDFQKGVAKQQKDIAGIERKLAALSSDNSASARAQRAKLEAELYEAKAELEDTYYDRSVENQQEALDKELESFQDQKEQEIEGWEKYLENIELVVADSLAVVKENTSAVLATLQAMQTEYGLRVSETLINPWKTGEIAIQEYGAKLSMSLSQLVAMFGLTVDEFAAKLGMTTTELVGSLDITVAQLAETLGLTNEEMAARLGLTVTNLNNMMGMTIQELAANMGTTLPALAEQLGTTTAGLVGNLDMTMAQFAGKMGLTVSDLASKFGLTTQDLATKLGLTYQDLVNPFGLAMSTTVDELKKIETEYSNILAGITGDSEIAIKKVNDAAKKYTEATAQKSATEIAGSNKNNNTQASAPKEIAVGGKINAGSARIYASSYGTGGGRQYFASDPIYTVLQERNGYVLVRHHKLKSGYTGWFKKSDIKAYATGTKSLNKSGIVNIDELGEELILRAQNGRLTYMEKGSGVIPADLTSNLMEWGKLDPTSMLEQNTPSIGVHPEIHNTEINLSITYGDMVSIGEFHGDNPEDIAKIVAKQFDKHTKDLNNALRKFVR